MIGSAVVGQSGWFWFSVGHHLVSV